MKNEKAIATFHAHRLGDVEKIRELLFDIENAYNNVYVFEILTDREFLHEFEYSKNLSHHTESLRNYLHSKRGSFHRLLMAEFFLSHPLADFAIKRDLWGFSNVRDIISADAKLELISVNIQSPGFWEFAGALNPLKTVVDILNLIREWQNDKFRRKIEGEKAIRERLFDTIKGLRETSAFLRESGFSEEEIQNIIRNHLILPLNTLSKHLDARLIDYAEVKKIE